MNVELLRKIQVHILAEPLRIHMNEWHHDMSNRSEYRDTRYGILTSLNCRFHHAIPSPV